MKDIKPWENLALAVMIFLGAVAMLALLVQVTT